MVNIYVLSMEENTFLVEHIKRQIEKQTVGDRIMKLKSFIKKNGYTYSTFGSEKFTRTVRINDHIFYRWEHE